MPHIVIKAIKGASKEQMQSACEQAIQIVSKELNKPLNVFSAAFEEYSKEEWNGVYKSTIKDNPTVVIKPEYTVD